MNRTEKALACFRKPYSCAQTIVAAFGKDDEATMAVMKAASAGRAPEGRCGALWAAMTLLDEKDRPAFEAAFAKEAGAAACRQIKGEARTPCERCVEIAASRLESYLPEN